MTRHNKWRDGEDQTRRATLITMYGAWAVSIGLTVLRAVDELPQQYGVVIVVFIGVAIAAGQARTRHKLADSIVAAFETGARESERNRGDIIAADVREAVEHVQAARRAQEAVERGAAGVREAVEENQREEEQERNARRPR